MIKYAISKVIGENVLIKNAEKNKCCVFIGIMNIQCDFLAISLKRKQDGINPGFLLTPLGKFIIDWLTTCDQEHHALSYITGKMEDDLEN